MPARYPIPAGRTRAELVIKNSRFITQIAPAESSQAAQSFIKDVSSAFGDANHNCWAYVVGPPGSTAQIGMSDDGEPHNTAGRPMLNVLLHAEVGDVVAVVTRYFGGVKLGRGGLVRAYGQAVKEALDQSPSVEKVDWVELAITADYASAPAISRLLPSVGAELLKETFDAQVQLRIRVPAEQKDALSKALDDATRGRASLNPVE